MQQLKSNCGGFTLLEALLGVAIFSVVVVAVGAFQRDVFFFNDVIQVGLTNVTEARKVLRPFVGEVRSAQPSNLGASAIEIAATSTFAFYSDIDDDGLKERIRYFVDGTNFKKGVTKPTGNPFVYDSNNESIINVVHYVVPEQTAFSYYGTQYTGATSSSALPFPVSPSEIRLVRIDLTVDANPNRAPNLMTITTQATVRNLKDNYED